MLFGNFAGCSRSPACIGSLGGSFGGWRLSIPSILAFANVNLACGAVRSSTSAGGPSVIWQVREHALTFFFRGALCLAANGFERFNRRGIQRSTINRKMRSMAGAIPAPFEGIPVEVTAYMSASGRYAVYAALFIPVRCNLPQPLADDGARSRLQIVDEFQLTGCKILGKIRYRSDVLCNKVLGSGKRDAGRVIKAGPWRGFPRDEPRQQETTCNTMG